MLYLENDFLKKIWRKIQSSWFFSIYIVAFTLLPSIAKADRIQFLKNGQQIVVSAKVAGLARNPDLARIFDTRPGKIVKTLDSFDVLYAPDESFYVAAGQPVKAFSPSGRELRSYPSNGYIKPLAFSPNGKVLFGQGQDGYSISWDAQTGKELGKGTWVEGIGGPSYFSPSSRFLYTGSSRGLMRLSMEEPGIYKILNTYSSPGRVSFEDCDVDFHYQLACTAGILRTDDPIRTKVQVTVHRLSGQIVKNITIGSVFLNERFVQVRFSRSGKYLAVLTQKGLTIHSSLDLKILRRYTPEKLGFKKLKGIEFSPTTNLLGVSGQGVRGIAKINLP